MCRIDVNVKINSTDNAWVVDLEKGNRHIKTFLEPKDANPCMEGRQCVGLGMQIYPLRDNIKNMTYS